MFLLRNASARADNASLVQLSLIESSKSLIQRQTNQSSISSFHLLSKKASKISRSAPHYI